VSESVRVEPRGGAIIVAGVLSAALFSALLLPSVLQQAGAVLGLVAVIAPFPLAQLRLKAGARPAMVAVGLGAMLVAMLSPAHAALFLLLVAPVLLIAEAVARGRGLLQGCGWAGTLMAIQLATGMVLAGPQLAGLVLTPLESSHVEESLEGLRESGVPSEQVDAWADQLESAQAVLSVVWPAAYFIVGGMLITLNALLLRGWLLRRRPEGSEATELETLRWPLGLAVAFCALGGAVVVPMLQPIAYNGLLVVAFLYALQGLSVVGYYLRRLAGPPMLRGALLVLVLINPWAPQILALVGLFDTWLDFRRWADRPEDDEDREGEE
jgi:uncharacterized protein YybS (DUF2232 family)